ncbi:MAG: CRTAC1 family protein [Acidobacteria bacterium]|nr:CRTAC1 family protein [Acidobacteriota bacterium]MDA1236718.1 CRTAC1 family protein [Acidobacteriota bacterium]
MLVILKSINEFRPKLLNGLAPITESLKMLRFCFLVLTIALAACEDSSPTQSGSVDTPQLFVESAAATGLNFDHFIGSTGQYYLPEIMGSGVALLDFDLDGDLDVYFVQGAMLDKSKSPEESTFPPKSGVANRLFENRLVPDGRLSFVDATATSRLGDERYGMGVAVGDYDADGDPDLYVTNVGPNVLYRNNGDGTFSAVEGPQDTRWSTSAAFVDHDGDGDLDLFFTNYVGFTPAAQMECLTGGLRDYCAPRAYQPVPDRLFRNDGGKFTDVSNEAGLGTKFGNGLGVTTADFNNDGHTDIYVANDGTENQLWINRGGGKFEELGMISGTAVNVDGSLEAGMGVSAEDFDGDGDIDIFLTHLTRETNTLYLNDGSGSFRDATNSFGLAASSVPFTGFGLQWQDFDLDGRLDLFITNGAVTGVEAQRGDPYPYFQDDLFYRGTEAGFESVAGRQVWGEQDPQIGRGMAAGDIDNDGDIDVVISNNNGPAQLFINQTESPIFIKVKPAGNSLGARVGISFADGTKMWRRVHSDGSYLSSSEPAVVFGLKGMPQVTSLEVIWPNGDEEQFAAPAANTVFSPVKGTGTRR